MRRALSVLVTALLLGTVLPTTPASAHWGHRDTRSGGVDAVRTACEGRERIRVPGADLQRISPCLPDLTTAGLLKAAPDGVYTSEPDWRGLHAPGTATPTVSVRGIQVDGYFTDTEVSDTATVNTLHGWNHDSQFVIRLPERWNGRLVVAGAPGVRKQYSSDVIISDHVLSQGYAYASVDKGNSGVNFFRDGERPGDAIREWHARVTQVARAAQRVVRQTYGQRPERTYMTGISNGGYLTRWQLENRPGVFDGGVDWEGTLFERDNNLLDFLPQALRAYPTFRDAPEGPAKEAARQAMYDAGFEPGSEFLWDLHYNVYWDLTQRIYREELDPTYDGDLEASITPTCPLGKTGCAERDIAYDPSTRTAQLDEALRGITLTGKIKRPMLSLHGDLDTLLPIDLHGDRYRDLVEERHRDPLHRYYVVEGGQHVDSFYALFPDRIRPILPCYRDAFDALVAWVERGVEPPASGPVQRASGDVVNTCDL
ncbi:MAG: tannase/feruloyl esterase family alpha/beta hydrolase [Actinomycetota bacterium]|nr:tannase/feruloyl esterase family alpha/beta hydrolase [Actinomycetota bacterium]